MQTTHVVGAAVGGLLFIEALRGTTPFQAVSDLWETHHPTHSEPLPRPVSVHPIKWVGLALSALSGALLAERIAQRILR